MSEQQQVPMKDPGDYLDYDECESILAHGRRPLDKIIIALMWRCGLRTFEIGQIKRKHLMDDGSLIVLGKGESINRIPVEPELYSWLRELAVSTSPEDYLITLHNKKTGISRVSVWLIVKQAYKDAGILVTKSNRAVHPHCFRHSLAIFLVKSGIHISKVQQILRHKSLSSTTFYSQFTIEELASDYLAAWKQRKGVQNETTV